MKTCFHSMMAMPCAAAVCSIFACAVFAMPASAAILVAQYNFNSNLVSSSFGAPALVAVDPLGKGGFNSDTVNGKTQTVYTWNGNATPVTEQAGFTLDTTGLVATNSYSVEMIFKLTDREANWRRLIDVENRQSDDGFYVDPGDHLAIFPITSSVTAFTNNVYEDVFLTVDNNTVSAYLNGQLQLTGNTSLMNININNTGKTVGFFLDNEVGSGIGEFSNGSIALLRLYNGVLKPTVPTLSVFHTTTNSVVVSWPSFFSTWSLHVNTNLATANWTAYTGTIQDDGTNKSVVISPPTGMEFFRLSNP